MIANQAKTQFGDLLLKTEHAPVQINKNGKPVAVIISSEEYEGTEQLKLQLLNLRAVKAQEDIRNGNLVDAESFFNELESGKHD